MVLLPENWQYCSKCGQGAFSYLLRDRSACGLSQGWGLALEKWLPLAEDSAQGETHLCVLSSKSPPHPQTWVLYWGLQN